MGMLDERRLERITVRELVARAGVSKNSFYAYYDNIMYLVQDCFMHDSVFFGPDHMRRSDFADGVEAAVAVLDQRARQLEFYRGHPNFARAILTNVGISPYYAQCERAEIELNLDHLTYQYGAPLGETAAARYDFTARYIFMGTYGLFRTWFAEGMRQTIEPVVKAAAYASFQTAAGVAGRSIEPEYRDAVERWKWA